ncbi:MAG: efflux RND transporter permease subunit [Bacteroidales bacterium]
MKKLIEFAVDFPVSVSMVVLGVLLLGYISLQKLSIDLLPEMNSPRLFVEMKVGERPPEEIEKQYVENIESQSIRLKGVFNVSSVCMVGSARITIEYNWGTDMDEAFLDLQKALTFFSQNSEIEEFNITQHDPNAAPVMLIAMKNDNITDMNELRQVGENYIRNELIRLEGVADVVLSGTEEKEVVIETDQARLNAYGLTTDNIVQQIQNVNRNVSGGSIVEMGKKYIIKGVSLIKDITELENLVITYKQGTSGVQASLAPSISNRVPVFLKDLARLSLVNKKPENIVRVNGKRCIGLSIYKETSFNTVKTVDELNKAFETIKKSLPGFEFTVVQNQGFYIRSAIDDLKNSAWIGAFLTILVLFVFLRRIGLTLIVSFAIPVSVIATFNLMYFNGLSINIMTLGGLALGVGMLVDNAIVVVESIFRNLEQGLSLRDAVVKGTSEIGSAIISSTVTTIVVFLPIVYLHGASGALFKDQAWTVTFSLIASLLVALFLIPMMFHSSFKKAKRITDNKAFKFNWYTGILSGIIDHRKWVITGAVVLISVSILVLPEIGSEFIPKAGTGEFSVEVKLKEGTRLERTLSTINNIETILKEVLGDRAEIIYSQIGPSSVGSSEKAVFQNENTASVKIKLSEKAKRNSGYIINKVGQLMSEIPEAEITIVRDETAMESTMGTSEAPLIVEVKGEDLEILANLTREVKEKLTEIPELYNIKTSIEEGAPEINLVIDRYKASMYNLNAGSISSQLKDILIGKNAGKYDNSGEMSDITIKMPEMSLSEFNSIVLKSGSRDVPLYEIASFEKSLSPKQLLRDNQNRVSQVSAYLQGKLAFDKVVEKVRTELKKINLPADYQVNVVGEELKRDDAMRSLGFALILSVILVYMVMASQFESLIHPFTVLLTIPLAAAGTILTFYLLGRPFNMMAYIGLIMLGGIAVNNSILLVDAINQLKQEGHALREAILFAGYKRIRPILMTSITTILALIPLTLGFGESSDLQAPMAIAVISGLTTSTLLTLVVIPCVYYVFDRGKQF